MAVLRNASSRFTIQLEVSHTARAFESYVENQGLVCPSTARAPS